MSESLDLGQLEALAKAPAIRGMRDTLASIDCVSSDHPLDHAGICGTCHQRLRHALVRVIARARDLEEAIGHAHAALETLAKKSRHRRRSR